MTPAEHYAEAERILTRQRNEWVAEAEALTGKTLTWEQAHDVEQAMVATAQVHAVLATTHGARDVSVPPSLGLTDRERAVLRDAVDDTRRSRPVNSVRVSLLESAAAKIGLYDNPRAEEKTDV